MSLPIAYDIDGSAGLVSIDVSGDVDAADVTRLVAVLSADPALRRGMPQLVDIRRLTPGPPLAAVDDVVYALARLHDRFAGTRTAVVTATSDHFDVIGELAMVAGRLGLDVAPFTDLGAAHQWLDRSGGRA